MNELKYSSYNFDIEKIIFHLNGIMDKEDKLEYLRNVINDIDEKTAETGQSIKEQQQYYADQNIPEGLSKIKVILELEVNKLLNQNAEFVKDTTPEETEVRKINVTSGISDIVRIFEAMKKAGIISSTNTDVGKIAGLFFTETLDINKFQGNYNARKNDILNNERNSNSEALAEFIKILIENSFSQKDAVLEDIFRHIERLQKNSI